MRIEKRTLPRHVLQLINQISEIAAEMRTRIKPDNKIYPKPVSDELRLSVQKVYNAKKELKIRYKDAIKLLNVQNSIVKKDLFSFETENKANYNYIKQKDELRAEYSEKVSSAAFLLGAGNCDVFSETLMFLVKNQKFHLKNIKAAKLEQRKWNAENHVYNLLTVIDDNEIEYQFVVDAWIGLDEFSPNIALTEFSLYGDGEKKYANDPYIIDLKKDTLDEEILIETVIKNCIKKHQKEVKKLFSALNKNDLGAKKYYRNTSIFIRNYQEKYVPKKIKKKQQKLTESFEEIEQNHLKLTEEEPTFQNEVFKFDSELKGFFPIYKSPFQVQVLTKNNFILDFTQVFGEKKFTEVEENEASRGISEIFSEEISDIFSEGSLSKPEVESLTQPLRHKDPNNKSFFNDSVNTSVPLSAHIPFNRSPKKRKIDNLRDPEPKLENELISQNDYCVNHENPISLIIEKKIPTSEKDVFVSITSSEEEVSNVISLINLNILMEGYDELLRKRNKLAVIFLKKNTILSDYIFNKTIQVIHEGSQIPRNITIDELIKIFESAMISRNRDIMEKFLNHNSLLIDFISGEPVKDGKTTRTISLRESISIFEKSFASHCSVITERIFKLNPFIEDYISCKEVQFFIDGLQIKQTIESTESFRIFENAIWGQCPDAYQVLLEKNILILQGIKDNNSIAQKLLEKIIIASSKVNRTFFNNFLAIIDDDLLLQSILDKNRFLMSGPKIQLLQARIEEIKITQLHIPKALSTIDIPKQVPSCNNLIESTQNIVLFKRKENYGGLSNKKGGNLPVNHTAEFALRFPKIK